MPQIYVEPSVPIIPPTEKVNSAVPKSAQLPTSTNTREFYRAFLGDKNPEYYLAKFLHFDRQGHGLRASWNWPALLSGLWLLYRKMYGWFFVFCGIVVVSSLFEKSGHPGISLLIIAVPWVLFPVFANALYHNKVKQKIAAAQLAVNEEQKIIEFLRRKGGVNTWVPWLYSGLVLIGIFAAIAVPNYLVYKEKAKSAQLNRGTSAQQQGPQSQGAQSESTVTPKDSREAPRQSQTAPSAASNIDRQQAQDASAPGKGDWNKDRTTRTAPQAPGTEPAKSVQRNIRRTGTIDAFVYIDGSIGYGDPDRTKKISRTWTANVAEYDDGSIGLIDPPDSSISTMK